MPEPKILFIHGFGSRGLGNKSRALQDCFGPGQVLAPDLSPHPTQAIIQLQDLIDTQDVDLLLGSSLGGYYATWLNRRRSIPAVLVNPAVMPFALLEDFIGEHRYEDGERFSLGTADIRALRRMHRPLLRADEHYLVLLQTGDQTLDYRQAAAYYAAKEVVVEQGGDHRFRDFQRYLPRIAAWREQYAQTTQSPP